MPTMITSRSDSIHSAEHPCANHDNVQIRLHPFPQSIHVPTMISSYILQIRLHPFPQSIHVPTMITSRSDSIHRPDQTPSIPGEHPCANHDILIYPPDQTTSIPAEHPCANHDNVQIRLHPFPQSIHGPTMITSRSDSIHSRRASMCQP